MPRYVKTVEEKLLTKISRIPLDDKLRVIDGQVFVNDILVFTYSVEKIEYTNLRYYPTLKDELVEENFTVSILLDHQTLTILSDKMYNPPRGAKNIIKIIRDTDPTINAIVIGGNENKLLEHTIFITYALYEIFTSINQEEGKDKVVRVRNRTAPFLRNDFGIESEDRVTDRNYSLLLDEIIASGNLSQEDIVKITNELDSGEQNEVVIEQQITKQAQWLLDAIQEIIDEPNLTKTKSQEYGKRLFNFPKNTISGPEDLMEKILSTYGQNIIFGVPALLNIDKYIISKKGLPKSQLDIILITHLSDIEIVELKRPDEYLLSYDDSRGKFFISKSLAVAVSQSERYISAIYRENDPEYTIDGKSIREYIELQIGGTVTLSICRPTAVVIIGTIQRLVKPYDELSEKIKRKVTKNNYIKNSEQAYKELKASFRNIQITTYTELVEGARLRLQNI